MAFDHIEAFLQPTSIREAVRLLKREGRRACLVAGGTEAVVQRDRSIRTLVDVSRLGLCYIRRKGSGWAIGAATTMATLEESRQIREFADGILAAAVSTCGSMQIRNMATLGGNLANASPAADTPTPLLALDASVVLASSRGRRTVPLSEFFLGPSQTILNGALLVEILIPGPPRRGRTGWSFQKLGRTESDISVVNCAAGLQVGRTGKCIWARVALGAVAPTPLRAQGAEAALIGQPVTKELIEAACDAVLREIRPIADLRASAEYHREMSLVLTRRALRQCAQRAGCPL
ncbi:MAG TPA: xanthine dehydrogenase family protein subunit M [Candidatus Eremiobacteraceae bacterium]|nr:xanthine dehydrogenase family protein subunit M [Candidatus Eremiobacteraceae bacterium]